MYKKKIEIKKLRKSYRKRLNHKKKKKKKNQRKVRKFKQSLFIIKDQIMCNKYMFYSTFFKGILMELYKHW